LASHKLTVISGPAAGTSVQLDGELVIGRSDGDLTIPDSEISRRHASIRPANGGVVIEDLGSRNGTFVDGRQISEPVTVRTGVRIQLGGTELRLELPLDTTRVSERPVVAAPPPAAPAEPAAAEPAPAEPAAPPRRRGRLWIAIAALVAVAAIAAVAILLFAGESEETEAHTLNANVTTLPLGDPTSFQVAGEIRGEPLGRVAVIVQRRFEQPPEPGGGPSPMRGFMVVTGPDGNMSLDFRGTVRLSRGGGETLRARGIAANGTGEFEGLTGTFRMSGGRPDAEAQTARYRVTGELDY
jgi:pSer/pThr/pTyr-binding forkhead associated (FHA) protein